MLLSSNANISHFHLQTNVRKMFYFRYYTARPHVPALSKENGEVLSAVVRLKSKVDHLTELVTENCQEHPNDFAFYEPTIHDKVSTVMESSTVQTHMFNLEVSLTDSSIAALKIGM